MARGKHKSRAMNQRSNHNSALLDQLRNELEMENTALYEAEETLIQISDLQSALTARNADLIENVAPYAQQLRQERDYLRTVFADISSHHSGITDAWIRYHQAGFDNTAGATRFERMESFNEVMGLLGFVNTNQQIANKNSSVQTSTRIQRARGERRNVSGSPTSEGGDAGGLVEMLDLAPLGHALIRPEYRQLLLDQSVVFCDEKGWHHIRVPKELTEYQNQLRAEALNLAARVWNSRAGNLGVDEIHVWGTGSVISSDGEDRDQLTALGLQATPTDTTVSLVTGISTGTQLPLASTPASSRNALAQQKAESALGAWRDVFDARRRITETLGLSTHPFAPLAHHPHPAQGLAVQNTYALSAFSRWIHQGLGSAYAQAAIGLTAAATYWLPAGQTASFAESEPLNDDDRAEMVLPFPQVFLAFAEPLVLDPKTKRADMTEKKWRILSEVTHDLYRDKDSVGSGFDHALERTRPDIMILPTLDEMLSEVGAHIEGILLLADSLGRPEDRFAWCLTVPGAYGTTLGRFVVPALRSATEYRDVIDNLTAVVAWAQWHEPDHSTDVPLGVSAKDLEDYISSPDFQHNAKRAGAGIRVVDVRATNRSASSRAPHDGDRESTDTNVAPHIRRGHWRRQRFGQGLQESKRIRIAPVLVNAHRGDIAHRVYRLRRSPRIVLP